MPLAREAVGGALGGPVGVLPRRLYGRAVATSRARRAGAGRDARQIRQQRDRGAREKGSKIHLDVWARALPQEARRTDEIALDARDARTRGQASR